MPVSHDLGNLAAPPGTAAERPEDNGCGIPLVLRFLFIRHVEKRFIEIVGLSWVNCGGVGWMPLGAYIK